jgi:hypothetical protein
MVRKHVIQLSFAVLVNSTDFCANPDEYSAALWANKDMLADLHMTEDIRGIVSVALDRTDVCGF